jgi:hypothetical protein
MAAIVCYDPVFLKNYNREVREMNKQIIVLLALALYWANPASADDNTAPAECKNLALMQAQLLQQEFSNANMGDKNNPGHLTLKTNNGLKIGKIEYLGGDSEDETKPGTYPCDQDKNLCTSPLAGGAMDWERITVTSGDATPYDVAQVVVVMGSRGGCRIVSAKAP